MDIIAGVVKPFRNLIEVGLVYYVMKCVFVCGMYIIKSYVSVKASVIVVTPTLLVIYAYRLVLFVYAVSLCSCSCCLLFVGIICL